MERRWRPRRRRRPRARRLRGQSWGPLCQPLNDDSVEQIGFLQRLVLISQLFIGERGHEDETGGSHGWPSIYYEEPDVADPVQGEQTQGVTLSLHGLDRPLLPLQRCICVPALTTGTPAYSDSTCSCLVKLQQLLSGLQAQLSACVVRGLFETESLRTLHDEQTDTC